MAGTAARWEEQSVEKNTTPTSVELLGTELSSPYQISSGDGIGESGADLAFPVFAPDAVAFFLGFAPITPMHSVTAFGATAFGLLYFAAHSVQRYNTLWSSTVVEHALDLQMVVMLAEEDAMFLSA